MSVFSYTEDNVYARQMLLVRCVENSILEFSLIICMSLGCCTFSKHFYRWCIIGELNLASAQTLSNLIESE